jgi:indolepyruvate decarboxylase
VADAAPITPTDIATAVNFTATHGKTCHRLRHYGVTVAAYSEIRALPALLAPGYYATMGFGVPAGLRRAATGQRPPDFGGRWCFQMTGVGVGQP